MIRAAKIQQGYDVLVYGATGAIGSAAGQLLKSQDGVWLGRAIGPVEVIAPGEAPPEWNHLVRFVGSCVVRVAAGTRRWGRRGSARQA
jgi:hypothetical protein